MTLDELRDLVAGSVSGGWHALGAGPAFFTAFVEGAERPEGEERLQWRLWPEVHHDRACLRSNLDVGLAWGLPWGGGRGDEFDEAWCHYFADPKAHPHYVDVLWRGQPVIRERYLTVDGYVIPLPEQNFEEITPRDYALMPYTMTPWSHAVGRLVHELSEHGKPYEEGIRRAKIEIADADTQ